MSNMTKWMDEKERWSQGLPDDILQLIARRLYISDYQVFRQVCPSWRAAVDRGIATQSCPPAAPQLPWLLVIDCHKFWSGNPNFLNAFYVEDKYSFSFLRGPTYFSSEKSSSRYYIGSIESWLIVAVRQQDTVVSFFFNPVSRVRVMLPSNSLFLVKMVASYPPKSPQQNNCFAAALCYGNRLGICRPTDTSWSTFTIGNTHWIDYSDIEIIDQKLYVAGRSRDEYNVLEFDIVTEDDNVTRALYNCQLRFDGRILSGEKCPSLAKDSASKELFIVILPKDGITQRIRVYKMDNGKPSCEEVTDLGGDRILFLSKRSNKVISDKTLGRNCIYFASDYDSWVYSLTDMSFRMIHFPMDYSSPCRAETFWFTPHPW